MPRTSSDKFSLTFILGLATLIVSAMGALGVVWVRQQVATTAEQTKQLEQRLAKMERKHQYLGSRIAEVHQPSYLKARVAGKLDLPNESAVIWADVPSKTHLAKATPTQKPFIEPFTLSLDLAFLATAAR